MNGQETLAGEMNKNWGWILVAGIAMVILGTIGLGMTFWLTVASMLYFGILLLIGGGVQLINAFRDQAGTNRLSHILIALLYLVAGIILITKPVVAGLAMTALLAVALIIIGVFRCWLAFQARPMQGWGFILAAGLAAIALGVMIFAGWPETGLWVIGLFVAIEMILQGWTLVMIAIAARQA